ncbi:DUF3551 domain-containing protein [Rhodoplanes sp. TEM]|uniref:DUF3551 domain-containing protein n=1 Tax=Rhodoplanes tepidamans TaxID=200616 RepID=A0ABT5J6G7_RHOTP|nr:MULTISPECIES: DUF3551 domain-containing protein [Rhodoplanes]MDC7784879.1 DUF3551 domain-containing protein [Rhodoplanes tepidamans]MDC7986065.1 DUF3551 domain-containing protein [Rhodoplanes sp. TEM]MDQ0353893.1 hypothetical protein [Rhodoplanes tepidamans]
MRALLVTAGLAAAIVAAGASAGHAQVPSPVGPIYPWCADYGGRGGGGTNCYFANLWQCQQAVSGNGGFCYENPFAWSQAPAGVARPRKAKRHSG